MKKFIAAALLIALALNASAQRFDWLRTYSGRSYYSGPTKNLNKIVGSFVDAEENTYILGHCSPTAKLCLQNDTGGVDVLPPGVFNALYPYQCLLIAKLSPSGDLVWHKAIYGARDGAAWGLCPIGDTAFMVMVNFGMAHNAGLFLWYLDTLLTSDDYGYLQTPDSACGGSTNGFITFDFDGNVVEQHFLEVGYIDSAGRALTVEINNPNNNNPYRNALYTFALSTETFAVDHDGNIYIARSADDDEIIRENDTTVMYTVANGKISALKIMVDGSRSIVYPLGQRSALWNQQILKFSPHFDSLVCGTYVFDSSFSYTARDCAVIDNMVIDSMNNLYVSVMVQDFRAPQGGTIYHIPLCNSDSLHLDIPVDTNEISQKKVIVVYDSNLYARKLLQLSFTCDSGTVILPMHDLYIDYESNSIFVAAASWWSPSTSTPTLYEGDTIDIKHPGTSFWMRLDLNDKRLLSYGLARPYEDANGNTTDYGAENYIAHVVAKNNRVFSQVKFFELSFGDTALLTDHSDGMALAIWDYDGNEIFINNYDIASTYDINGPVHLRDSVLYLTGTLNSDATFGPIHHRSNGTSNAYVARYVDTAFMTPYVHRGHGEGIRRPQAATAGSTVYPNPTTGRVNIRCGGEKVMEVKVISAQGRVMTAKRMGDQIDLAPFPSGIYYLLIKTEKATHRNKIVKL